jgi:heat shock protein HtpX
MYEQIARNRRASWLLMGLLVAILAALGYVFGHAYFGSPEGGLGLLGVFGVVAIVWSIVGYYSGDRMVLAVSGAHPVTHDDEPRLFNIVEEMTIAAGLPHPPATYVIEEDTPNAFATGRDPQHASIAVTRGLMRTLNREELQGVIAHELSHVRNYDIRFATLVGVLVGVIALVADFFVRFGFFGGFGRRRGGGDASGNVIVVGLALLLAVVAPLAAYMVQLAVSRRREYLADASGVELTRNPLALARALNKIAADTRPLRHANRATAHLYIENPRRKDKEYSGVFDTHPPVRRRIAVLLEMAHVGPEALTADVPPPGSTGESEAASSPAGAAEAPIAPPAPPPGVTAAVTPGRPTPQANRPAPPAPPGTRQTPG